MLAVLLIATMFTPLWGQTGAGVVQGTVRDSSQAVVPEAAVTLTNTATNVVFRTAVNRTGFYMFPAVTPGQYRLNVEAAGMQKFEGQLTLQAQQTAVVDPVLQVGQTATSIVVQDVTPLVTADAPKMGVVLDRVRVEQIPHSSTNPAEYIAFMVPGAQGSWNGRAYGLPVGNGETLVDGASTIDRTWGVWQTTVKMEAVQEVAMETSSSSAKFSRPVNVVVSTRSGTNALHGSLYEGHRNSAFGTARKRQDFWTKAPHQVNNEFGGSAGGPVWLPGIYNGRNRTFWFVTHEQERWANPKTKEWSVPTAAMRQGDFSGLFDAAGRRFTLYDPWSTDTTTWTRQPFSHGGTLNRIDPSRLTPVAKYLFDLAPMPTTQDNPLVTANLWMQVPIDSVETSTTARLDHQFSANDRVFARYTAHRQDAIAQATSNYLGGCIKNPDIGRQINHVPSENMAISHTRVFSPTLFNELLVTGARTYYKRNVGAEEDFTGQLGLPNPLGVAQFPQIANAGLNSMNQQSGLYLFLNQGNILVSDNATKIHNNHEFQFGGSVRYEQMNFLPTTGGKSGAVNFATGATGLYDPKTGVQNPGATAQTGHDLANLYLGSGTYATTFRRHTTYARHREYALYFQDNYKVTPRLTLNLGLRWEHFSELSEKNGTIVGFDPQQKAVVLGADPEAFYRTNSSLPSIVSLYQSMGVKFTTASAAGYPRNLTHPNWKNFGPRLGFAWRLGTDRRSSVLRGGYRISYSTLPISAWETAVQNNVPLLANYTNNWLTSAAQSPDGIAAYGLRSVPTIIAGVNSRDALNVNRADSVSRGSASMTYFDPHQPTPRVQDWNLTLEKEILPQLVARAAYIGNHSSNGLAFNSYNDNPNDYLWYTSTGSPKPTGAYSNVAMRPYDQEVWGSIREILPLARSNYSGIQLELERRYSRGIVFHAFYNMNNALDTGDNIDSIPTIPALNQFLPGTVPTDLKERQHFLNYSRNTAMPKHRIMWNWVVDLPFGRGKRFASNSRGVLEKLIGGWQLAGRGSMNSRYFSLPTDVYPTGTPVEIYGEKYPIQDCRSGVCRTGYLWWNGYIPAHQINSVDANGKPNGIMGVPADYKPAGQPLIPWPQNPNKNDPMYAFYGTNTVWVPMKSGPDQRTTYNPGTHPWRNQRMPGVWQWGLDSSLYKRIDVAEGKYFNLSVSAFNVLNRPGTPNAIGADGVLPMTNSDQAARAILTTLRFTW